MSSIDAKTRFLSMIKEGRKTLGILVTSLDPASTDIMDASGFDYVVLDNEHGRLSRVDVEHHVRAAERGGAIPFVRILENSPSLIQSMLDVGAHGLVVPHVDSADDARAAVAASRYAPGGRRGMCPACYAGEYGLDNWPAHVEASDANVMIIPIIESRRAVENIEEIVAVDGIDIVHFGPGDLSADMGLDFNSERGRMEAAYRKVCDAAHAAGKYVLSPRGYGFDDAEMLIVEMDLMLLRRAAAAIVRDHGANA